MSEETLRYWKRTFPELAGRRGYGPCYTFSEVLVLLITQRLVTQLGVDVTKLVPMAEALFVICRESPRLLTSAGETVWIDIETMKPTPQKQDPAAEDRPRLGLPLHALALELRGRVLSALGDDEAAQMLLPFGPIAVARASHRAQA